MPLLEETVLLNSLQYKVAWETFPLFAEFQVVEQKLLSGGLYCVFSDALMTHVQEIIACMTVDLKAS